MRKTLQYIIAFLVPVFIIYACQRDVNPDNVPTGVNGSLSKSSSGDCAPVTLGGVYVQSTALAASNYMDVQVNFTSPGSFEIRSDTINGYFFKASGQATTTGTQMVRLSGSGTPQLAGTDLFTIRFKNSECKAAVVVNSSSAVYTFENAAGVCTGVTVAGSYIAGAALVPSNTATIRVNVTSTGSYSITTNTVNGISFSSSGSFTAQGVQSVELFGMGTPVVAGSSTFNTSTTGGCSFVVQVLNPTGFLAQLTTTAASGITCTAAISGGNITSDGGSPVTARGICYSTNPNPTTANFVVNSGSGSGIFTSNLSGLVANTTYHVRAFATNSAGTAYGNEISFTTGTGCQVKIWLTGIHNVYNISGDIPTPKIWKDSTGTFYESTLPFTPFTGNQANGIFVSGTDVYVAGRENSEATIWKNGVAISLGTGNAYSVYVAGTDVYVAGEKNARATIWKNGVATMLNPGPGSGIALSVFVSGSDVYVAGYEQQQINMNWIYIAKIWKNGVGTDLSSGPANASANSVYVSGGDVYVAGKDGTAAKLWKNGVAAILPVSGSNEAYAWSVFVYGGDVYVAGTEDDGTSINSFAKLWKNGVGSYLTTSGYRNAARSVFVQGSTVYVAGAKSTGGANVYGGIWRNGFFTPVAGGSTDAWANGVFVK